MPGLIDSETGLAFQVGTGLIWETEIGGAGLTIDTGSVGTGFLLLANGSDYLLLTTGSDDKLVLAS